MKWTINEKLIAGFGLVIMALVALGGLSYWNTSNFADTVGRVVHTQDVLNEIESTLTTMVDAETGMRGYVITGKDQYLAPYTAAIAHIDGHLQNLTNLTSDNPLQQSNAAELKKSVTARLDTLAGVVEARRLDGFEAAQAMISTGLGASQMDAVRQALDNMRSEENSLLAERESKAQQDAQSARWSFLSLALLICVLVVVVYRMLKSDLRARREAVASVLESEQRFRQLSEATFEGIVVHEQGTILEANRASAAMFGYGTGELTGMTALELVAPTYHELIRRTVASESERPYEIECLRKDGSIFPVEIRSSTMPYGGRTVRVAALHDITERKEIEMALRRNEKQLFQFLEAVPVAIFVLDATGAPYYANETAKETLGKGVAPEASPTELSEVYHAYLAGSDEKYPAERMPIVRALAGEKAQVDDMEIHRPDKVISLQVSATPIFDEVGQLAYAIAAFNDISDQRQIEAKLHNLSIHDELTGLYNRRYMMRLLMEEGTRSLRYSRFFSLVMLDIDHFKAINDTHGHQAGDYVLRQVAQLIRDNIRSVDRPVRFGGEEMALILPEITADEAYVVAERIRCAVAGHLFTPNEQNSDLRPEEDGGEGRGIVDGKDLRAAQKCTIRTTISLGVACMPDDADSVGALVAAADKALYAAKHQGRNRTVSFAVVAE